jgi:hypothetical protein
VNFEEYLSSKKIDSDAFRNAEPVVWETWKRELEQMHPNSFTIQKLNLINPVRRKYPLKPAFAEASAGKQVLKSQPERILTESKELASKPVADTNSEKTENTVAPSQTTPPATKPAVARPVFKPKPKIN